MYRHRHRNFRFIGILFWVFPYLLWQSFGHVSGLLIGLLLSIILTVMINSLFHQNTWNMSQQPVRIDERQQLYQQVYRDEVEPYQCGYRAQPQPYRQEPQPTQTSQPQTPYEEMQVEYPEMPPMEQQ